MPGQHVGGPGFRVQGPGFGPAWFAGRALFQDACRRLLDGNPRLPLVGRAGAVGVVRTPSTTVQGFVNGRRQSSGVWGGPWSRVQANPSTPSFSSKRYCPPPQATCPLWRSGKRIRQRFAGRGTWDRISRSMLADLELVMPPLEHLLAHR